MLYIYILCRIIGKWAYGINIKNRLKYLVQLAASSNSKSLKEYDTKQGWIREMINFYINHNPFYINHLNRFNKIYACNYETQRNIPKAVVLPDVPLNDRFFNLNIKEKKEKNETIRLLFVGRLINKKRCFAFFGCY